LLSRDKIYLLKALAIISVVCAHTVCTYIVAPVFQMLGVLGVPIFFVLSGYLYKGYFESQNSIYCFFTRKIHKIFIPWMFCGTLTYLIMTICGSEKAFISIYSWIQYILGDGSHLYYLTVLILYFTIFYYVPLDKFDLFFISSILLNIYNVIILRGFISNYRYTPYLNPFYWIMFFGLGRFISLNENKISYIIRNIGRKLNYSIFATICITFILFCSFCLKYEIRISYFNLYGIIIETLCILLAIYSAILFDFAHTNSFFGSINIFKNIGKQSFIIYLLHLPVVGFLNLVFPNSCIWDLVTPILTIGIIIILIKILNLFETFAMEKEKYVKLFEVIKMLIGSRS
jgi:peptidoglycan/LPS O-acetylase OafA/YrhL